MLVDIDLANSKSILSNNEKIVHVIRYRSSIVY